MMGKGKAGEAAATGEWMRVCEAGQIGVHRAHGHAIRIGEQSAELILHLVAGEPRAYLNRCPHVGTPLNLAPDHFLDESARHFVCSTHGALFRVEDGLCVAGPCLGDSLTRFEARIRGDAVEVRLPPGAESTR